jgi:predicted nucleotidyltransferase
MKVLLKHKHTKVIVVNSSFNVGSLGIPSAQFNFLKKMVEADVRFVLIGGYALRFFKCERITKDVDILIDNDLENARKIRPIVVDYLGYEPKFTVEDFLKPRKQLKTPDELIDILTTVDGLNFNRTYDQRENKLEDGVIIPIVSTRDLIFIKESAAADTKRKEKELKDVECLKSK